MRFGALGQTVSDLYVKNPFKILLYYRFQPVEHEYEAQKALGYHHCKKSHEFQDKMRSFRAFYAFLGIRADRA